MSAGNDFHNRFNSEQAVDELNEPIIGILCDIDNDPLKCYYSEKAINEQIKANGKFVCPVTNEEFKFDQCKKVFIC